MALTRDERAAVNRRNAQQSTGPRTEQGKAVARANALKHGLTARRLVTNSPAEASEYDLRRRLWHDNLQPGNVLEAALVDRACRANWKLDLCARLEDTLRAQTPDDRPRDDYVAARRLVHNLLTAREAPSSPNVPDDPARDHATLCAFAEGVVGLLAEWDRLVPLLDRPEALSVDLRMRAVRLLGLKSEDELTCPLMEAARDEMARLEALHVELTEGPADAPETDLDPELLMRYEAAAEREFHRSVNTFLRLRKNPDLLPPPDLDAMAFDYLDPPYPEPEPYPAPAPEPDPAPEPVPAAEPASASSPHPGRRRPPLRNEPSAPADSVPTHAAEPSRQGSRRAWDGVDPFEAR